MKKFLGIVLLLSVLASVSFGDTYVWKGNAELKALNVTPLETVTLSDTTSWVYNGTYPGLALQAPWAGIVNASQGDDGLGGTLYHQYTTETRMGEQYGETLNIDYDFGDGTIAGYRHGTSTTAVYNVLGKWSQKQGTVNLNGHEVWTDGFQVGTISRLSFNAQYPGNPGKATVNVDNGAKLVIIGTMQVGYGVNVDAYMNVSGTGEVRAEGVGKIALIGAANSGAGQTATLKLDGSDATFSVTGLQLDKKSDCIQYMTWVLDDGGASSIDIIGTTMKMGYHSKLVLMMSEALANPSEEIVLVNLLDGAAVITGQKNGHFESRQGTELTEGTVVSAMLGATEYFYKLSYVGGTGNDVTLTAVPEPATLGLLSLGGLVLARRRRA